MITFSSFLVESKSAPLYHATLWPNIFSILRNGLQPNSSHLRSDIFKGDVKRNDYINGVSVSRSFKFASNFYTKQLGSVLELNQDRLSQRYKIKPIQYWSGFGFTRLPDKSGHINEYEEFIISKNNIPPRYISKLYVPESLYNTREVQNSLDRIYDMYGTNFIGTYK